MGSSLSIRIDSFFKKHLLSMKKEDLDLQSPPIISFLIGLARDFEKGVVTGDDMDAIDLRYNQIIEKLFLLNRDSIMRQYRRCVRMLLYLYQGYHADSPEPAPTIRSLLYSALIGYRLPGSLSFKEMRELHQIIKNDSSAGYKHVMDSFKDDVLVKERFQDAPRTYNIAIRILGLNNVIDGIHSVLRRYPNLPVISVGSGKGYLERDLKETTPGITLIAVDPSTSFGQGQVVNPPDYDYIKDLPRKYLNGRSILLLNYVPFMPPGGGYDTEAIRILHPVIVLFVFSTTHSSYPEEKEFPEYKKEILKIRFTEDGACAAILMKWQMMDNRIRKSLQRAKTELSRDDAHELTRMVETGSQIPALKSKISRIFNKDRSLSRPLLTSFYNTISTIQRQTS